MQQAIKFCSQNLGFACMNKPSLPHGFTFFAAIIILLLIALCVVYETWLEHSRVVVRQMENEATRIDRALIIEMEHSSHIIMGIGQEMMHMDTDDLNSIAYLLRSFDTTATVHHVFSWIDAKGNNVVSSNKGVHPPVDVADRGFLKDTIANPGKVQIGSPIQGRVSGKWALPVALGITDATGKYIGTVLISMDIHTITLDLQRAVKESGIYFAIYSTTFLPLTQSVSGEQPIKFDNYNEKLKSVVAEKHQSGVIANAMPFYNDSFYVYYELSATYPYIIMLGFDPAASTAIMRTLLVPRLIEILLFGALVLTMMWLVRSRVVRPITELAVITNEISHGKQYREPVSSGIGEIDMLARQIKKLNDYLNEIRLIQDEYKNKNIMLKNSNTLLGLTNKIKVEFMSAMSHDLRIPLNTIIGFAEIMKNQNYGKFESTQYLQYIQDIYEAAKQLQYLINDIKKLSNAETAMANLQEKNIDIRNIINKSLRLVAKIIADKKLGIELKTQESMPHLLMDEHSLEQILVNIIINIASKSALDSNIIIKAFMEKDHNNNESICISFDPVSAPEKPKDDNSQVKNPEKHYLSHLGLPLTKALASMHQAQLEVKTRIGKPASITIRFPKERII